MKKHLPNAFTLLNLFSGCCAIIACLQDNFTLVPIFIGISLFADFLDGFVARALHVSSKLGGELDSLSDVVSFGVLPGMMLYKLIGSNTAFCCNNILPYVGFVYALFASLRLAKFNLDTRQTENFIGLNTPSGALFVLGLYANYFYKIFNISILYHPISLIIITIILAYFMVAEFSMFSLKGNPFDWKKNKYRVLLLIFAVPQIIFLNWLGLSTIILSYIIFAYLHNSLNKAT